jgi:polyhydroxyalkanoate synthesis regulator phasin
MDAPAEPDQPAALRELVEEVLLAGLGAVSITREKADAVAEELVRRGKLTREDARRLADQRLGSSRQDGRRLTERASVALAGVFRELGLVTERQYAELELRVAQLEHRLRLLEKSRP